MDIKNTHTKYVKLEDVKEMVKKIILSNTDITEWGCAFEHATDEVWNGLLNLDVNIIKE